MRKNRRTGKRLRLIPLILGGYGVFLGFGLVAMGLVEFMEVIGMVRLLMGLGMAGFGLLGIWDGVRDLVRPEKKPKQMPVSQFILTDTSGNRSSLVTPELLREQMDIVAESRDHKSFSLQILQPLPAGEHGGMLKQITCAYHFSFILVAFFEIPEGGYRIYQKSTEPDMALEWLVQLLARTPDFSGWESVETTVCEEEDDAAQEEEDTQWDGAGADKEETDTDLDEAGTDKEGADADSDEAGTDKEGADADSDESDAEQEGVEAFWHQLLANQNGRMAHWHQLLVIFGESWHDEHKFFSVRDVELAVEGIHEGKYQKAVLEWGTQAFDLFPGVQSDLMVIWRTNNTGRGDVRFLAKEGTVTQVKFWLAGYLDRGFLEETSGWADITAQMESVTAQMEKEKRKGKKKHGKVL